MKVLQDWEILFFGKKDYYIFFNIFLYEFYRILKGID